MQLKFERGHTDGHPLALSCAEVFRSLPRESCWLALAEVPVGVWRAHSVCTVPTIVVSARGRTHAKSFPLSILFFFELSADTLFFLTANVPSLPPICVKRPSDMVFATISSCLLPHVRTCGWARVV